MDISNFKLRRIKLEQIQPLAHTAGFQVLEEPAQPNGSQAREQLKQKSRAAESALGDYGDTKADATAAGYLCSEFVTCLVPK
eukprot:3483740-Rhodomonas_salina.4